MKHEPIEKVVRRTAEDKLPQEFPLAGGPEKLEGRSRVL
jgi:hypothetical protein